MRYYRRLEDAAAGLEWHRRVTALGCQVCAALGESCEGDVKGHHVVYQQHIRGYIDAYVWEHDLTRREAEALTRTLIYDVRNGMGVCARAHRRHHSRNRPIPLRLVPLSAVVFAAEIGLGHRIERLYPADGTATLPA